MTIGIDRITFVMTSVFSPLVFWNASSKSNQLSFPDGNREAEAHLSGGLRECRTAQNRQPANNVPSIASENRTRFSGLKAQNPLP